jgi:hypothetical protein
MFAIFASPSAAVLARECRFSTGWECVPVASADHEVKYQEVLKLADTVGPDEKDGMVHPTVRARSSSSITPSGAVNSDESCEITMDGSTDGGTAVGGKRKADDNEEGEDGSRDAVRQRMTDEPPVTTEPEELSESDILRETNRQLEEAILRERQARVILEKQVADLTREKSILLALEGENFRLRRDSTWLRRKLDDARREADAAKYEMSRLKRPAEYPERAEYSRPAYPPPPPEYHRPEYARAEYPEYEYERRVYDERPYPEPYEYR